MLRILHLINKASIFLASIFLGIMVFAIFYQVVARYFFNNPPPWTEEISRYLQIWLVCLMVSPLLASSEHLEIDVVYDLMSKRNKRMLDIIRHVASLIFAVILVYFSIQLNLTKRPQFSPALEISMAWIYWSIPVMAFLVAANQIALLLLVWKKRKDA
jgi:TRAP-type transport system small permease protein